MGSYTRSNSFMKIISVAVAVIFLWNQIVWAGEPANIPLDAPVEEQIPGTPPEDFQQEQEQAQSLVNQLNEIEDFIDTQNSYDPLGESTDEEIFTYYSGSGRVHTKTTFDGTIYEYSDEDWERVGGNDGEIYGASWVDDDGRSVLNFDGVDDYVDCGNDESLDITGELTLEAWVKTTDTNGVYVISKRDQTGLQYVLYVYDGIMNLVYHGGMLALSATSVTDGLWHHLVITVDGTTAKGFVDGDLEITGTMNNCLRSFPSVPLYLGVHKRTDTILKSLFEGEMKEVGIYNKTLTAEEISGRHEGNDVLSGLVAAWNLDEGAGAMAGDMMSKRYGKLMNKTLAEANADGEIAFVYEYFQGTNDVRFMYSYSDTARTQRVALYEYDTNGELLYRASEGQPGYTYYPSGRVHTEVFLDGTIFEYIDEDWEEQEHGRVIKKTFPNGFYTTYNSYYPGTDRAKYENDYCPGGFFSRIETREYDINGFLIKKTDFIGKVYTYYVPSGFLRNEYFAGVYKEYLDENWNNTGRGRLIKTTCPDSSYYLYEDYFEGTNQARYIKSYGMYREYVTTPSGTYFHYVFGHRWTCEYDAESHLVKRMDYSTGTIYEYYVPSGRVYSKTLSDGTVEEYIDEDWNDQGVGRLIKRIRPDGSYLVFEEYYEGTDQAKYIKEYDANDNLFSVAEYDENGEFLYCVSENQPGYTYYSSGRVKTKIMFDGTIYEYSDEDWERVGGNDGEIYGASWVDDDGRSVLNFDGVDDYVDCGDDDSLDITGELTLEAWVKTTDTNGAYVISKRDQTGLQYVMYVYGGIMNLVYHGGMLALSATSVTDGLWHHLVITVDDTTAKGYVDGDLEIIGTMNNCLRSFPSVPLYLGAYKRTDTILKSLFEGEIKDVRIYNKTLTAEEISGRHEGNDVFSGLVAAWNLDEGAGTMAGDMIDERCYGRLIKETRPDGTYTVFKDHYRDKEQAKYVEEYDAGENLLSVTEYDWNGVVGDVYTYTYDSRDNCTSISHPGGTYEYFEYTYENEVVKEAVYLNTEYNNLIFAEYYDYEKGYVVSTQAGQGAYVAGSIVYDENALDAPKIVYEYSLDGDVLTQTGHAQHVDSQGNSVNYYIINRYDADDNLVSTTEKLSQEEYDDPQAVVLKTTTYTYDADGDVLSAIDGESKGYRYEYVKDGEGKITDLVTLDLEYGVVKGPETYDSEERLLTYNEGDGHWNDTAQAIVVDSIPQVPKIRNTYTDIGGGAGYTLESHVVYADAEGNGIDYIETTVFDGDENVVHFEDKEGNITDYTYDDEGNMLTEEYFPAGSTLNELMTCTYSHSYVNDESIEVITERYTAYEDTERTVIKEETEISRTYYRNTFYEVERYVEEISYSDPAGESVYVEKLFDSDGRLISETERTGDADPETTTYSYYADGALETIAYPGGRTETYAYTEDVRGRMTGQVLTVSDTDITGAPYTYTETTTYDPETGEVRTLTDRDGNVTTYTYQTDEKGSISVNTVVNEDIADPESSVTTIDTYNEEGNLLTRSEQVGSNAPEVTTYTYYADGTVGSVTYPLGEGQTQPKTVSFSYEYDDKGRLTRYVQNVTEPDGTVYSVTEEYNADGDIKRTIDADGNVYIYSYARSSTGKLLVKTVTEQDPEGTTVYIKEFDSRGNIVKSEDVARGLVHEYVYEYAYENTRYEYILTITETVTQNFPNNPGVEPIVTSTIKHFDEDGQITELADGNDNSTVYVYYDGSTAGGKDGDLKEVIDAKGNRTEYLYEYAGEDEYLSRKTVKYYSNDGGGLVLQYTVEQEYDPEGRVLVDKDKHGVTRTYEYSVSDDNVVTGVRETVEYTDDNGNNISYFTEKNYSEDGEQLLSQRLSDGTVETYTYDADSGKLLRMDTGEVTIVYTYDSEGALESSLETDNKGTEQAGDDIKKLTFYFGGEKEEKIKETRVFAPGAEATGKPVIREIYHYNSDGILHRIVKKELKEAFRGTEGDILESEYKDLLETIYGVFNGKVKKKREITVSGKEDFTYDDDGILVESTFTEGIYFSKTLKKYNIEGDVIQITSVNGLEEIVTDISYAKDLLGVITGKTETVTYREYDESSTVLEETLLSVKEYVYYGASADDGNLHPFATRNHEIRSVMETGKTRSYEYSYDENGYLEIMREEETWTEGEVTYTAVSYKKFDTKGDITASIDADGTYAEYEYSSDEDNEMGGRVQTQKLFYGVKDPGDISLGYGLYRVFPAGGDLGNTFDGIDLSGLSVSEVVREYNFENDLVSITKKNSPGEGDDQVTYYTYEKDQNGNMVRKYETESGKAGVKVYEYDLKGDLVSETGRNGIKTSYAYTRGAVDGHIECIEEANDMYDDYVKLTYFDMFGNITSAVDEKGFTRIYAYQKDARGILTGKTEEITQLDLGTAVEYYAGNIQTFEYNAEGDVSRLIDKNGVSRNYSYVYDAYGNTLSLFIIVSWDIGNKTRTIKRVYNPDGTESSVTYYNDPDDDADDTVKTYSYTYDGLNGTLLSMTESDSRYTAGTVYEYDLFGDAVTITSPNGAITDYLYERDLKGVLLRKFITTNTHSSAIEVEEYNTQGDKTSFTNSNGYEFVYGNLYDNKGNLVSVTETHERCGESGQLMWTSVETKHYDTAGRITSIVDKNDVTLTFTYETNAQGEVVKSYETDSRYQGQVVRVFDGFTSDILSVTDRLGHTTEFSYQRSLVHGGVIERSETDSLGATTIYNMDDLGRVVLVTDKFGREVTIMPEFDAYGNMIKRTLTWTEDINGILQDFMEEEYYSVDGDLIRRIDYTGKEFRYLYDRDERGNLTHMTTVESNRAKYSKTDVSPTATATSNASGTDSPARLFDGNKNKDATLSWNDPEDPASYVIDLGAGPPEYNTLKIYLRDDYDYQYKYKVFIAEDAGDTANWTLLVDKTDMFYSSLQQLEFDSTNARYIIIQGCDSRTPSGDPQSKLALDEVEIYSKEMVPTTNLTTTEYDTEGRVISKTDTSGETVYYTYEIGAKGEVLKTYERLTPEETVDVLVPVEINDVSCEGNWYVPETDIVWPFRQRVAYHLSFGGVVDVGGIIFDFSTTGTIPGFYGQLRFFYDVVCVDENEVSYTMCNDEMILVDDDSWASSETRTHIFDRVVKAKNIIIRGFCPEFPESYNTHWVYPSVQNSPPHVSHVWDDDFNTSTEAFWYPQEDPSSFIVNLTDDDSNVENVGAVGIALKNGEGNLYSYKVYYATAENPQNWEELVDHSDHALSRNNDWHIDKFATAVSAKYLRIQGVAVSSSTKLEIEEIKVYRVEERTNAVKIKELDEYGKTSWEKNALMLVWEEREDLREIFVNPWEKGTSGYWQDKTLVDWARLMGAWEDPRIEKYLSDYDNKTDPMIDTAFKTGDVSDKLLNVTAVNATDTSGISRLIDGVIGNDGHIGWEGDGPAQQLTNGIGEMEPALCLDGNDYLEVADSDDWDFGAGEWTMEAWFKPVDVSTPGCLMCAGTYNNNALVFYPLINSGNASVRIFIQSSEWNFKVQNGGWTADKWYHLAICRDGDTLRAFADGVEIGSANIAGKEIHPVGSLRIGQANGFNNGLKGHVKEVRVSDTARYTSDFTVPTEQFVADGNTKLLLHLDEEAGSTSWTDSGSTGHEVHSNGDPAYFVIELSEDTDIDKIRLRLGHDDSVRRYKYRIYTSLDGEIWGDPIVNCDFEYMGEWQEHNFDRTCVRYIRIEGVKALNVGDGSEVNRLNIDEVMIIDTSSADLSQRSYSKDMMRQWAKRCGFKTNAELVKFAKTQEMKDEAETKTYAYVLDEKGNIRETHITSTSGTTVKFYDEKGHLLEEIISRKTNSAVTELTQKEPVGTEHNIYDAYGRLVKTVYREQSPDEDFITGYREVKMENVDFLDSNYNPAQSEKNKVIDGNTDNYTGVTWTSGNEPASFMLTLEEESAISRIRLRLQESGSTSYRYKVFVRSGTAEEWTMVADKGQGTPWNWQDITFDEQDVKYIKIQGADEFMPQTYLNISEVMAYKAVVLENLSYSREFNADSDLIAERDILAVIWEEDEDLRDYFYSPGATGTGKYSGWSLKEWAAKVGSWTDSRLQSYKRYAREYTPELEAVLDADPVIKAQFTNPDGTINEYGAVNWACGADKELYPLLKIYQTDLTGLDDAYLANYSYDKTPEGALRSRTRVINYEQQTQSVYACDTDPNGLANFIMLDDTEHAYTGGGFGGFGIDGDWDTAQYCEISGTNSGHLEATSVHSFSDPRDIDTVHFKVGVHASIGSGPYNPNCNASFYVYWSDDNRVTWNMIDGSGWSGSAGNGGNVENTETRELTGLGLTGVTDIKLYVNTSSSGSDVNYRNWFRIYELKAKGVSDTPVPDILKKETKRLETTRKEYEYCYHDNGNVLKLTVTKSGHETGEDYMIYNYEGDIIVYHDNTGTYDYGYTYDKWNNVEKIHVNDENIYFLNNEETLVRAEAEKRITEYCRAMLYRDPTAEEMALHIAYWEDTGFTDSARECIWRSAEYISGALLSYEERAMALRDARVSGIAFEFTGAFDARQDIIGSLENALDMIRQSHVQLENAQADRKDENDKKYIIEIFREVLGREGTDDEIDESLEHMRNNALTLAEMRAYIRDSRYADEYDQRRSSIDSVINALYDTEQGTGFLRGYLDAEDKHDYVANVMGLSSVNSEYLVHITCEQILEIIAWLRKQDNHFGRSAVEALYKQLHPSENLNSSELETLLTELLFVDIITGVIDENTAGNLLISMHAIKKVAHKRGLSLYGTEYDADEFLAKFDEILDYSAIVHYNGSHFMNVTGVRKDAQGNITHVIVTNGYGADGTEQTKEIKIGEFRENYEGKLLSTERSDYDKRLTDAQLKNIKGAGWWQDLWKAIVKIFKKIVKAIKKIINYIIEPIKQLVNAIKFAIEQGKWGRVFGAIGTLIVASVASFFVPGYAFTIINTAMSMATAICYGQYTLALKSLALGYATFLFQGLLSTVNGLTNFIKSVGEKIGEALVGVGEAFTGAIAKVSMGLSNVVSGVISVYGEIVEAARGIGEALWETPKTWYSRAFQAIVNTGAGFVTNGIFRYISEEMDKTSNWLAKLGISFTGALFLTPFRAATAPNWSGTWCPGTDHAHIMLELGFETMQSVISNETYKALEDELGEEWYASFLRVSINSVISAGFDVLKQATHEAIWKEQTLRRYREMVEKYGESGDKNVMLRLNPETGNEIVYTTEVVNGKERIVAYADERFQMEADYTNNKVIINGQSYDIGEGLNVQYSENFLSDELGYSVRLEATFNLQSGELSNEKLIYNDSHLAINEDNGLKYAYSTDGRTFRVNPDNTITDITDVNLYVDYDKKVAFIEGQKATYTTNGDGTISISSGNSTICVSGDDNHTLLSHIVTTAEGDVFDLKINSSGIIDYANSTVNGQFGQLTATQLENGTYRLNMTADGHVYVTDTSLMNTYALVDDGRMSNYLNRGDISVIMPESSRPNSLWDNITDAVNGRLNAINDAYDFYDRNDNISGTNFWVLNANEWNKNLAATFKGMGWDTAAHFIRPDMNDRTSTYVNFYYESYSDYALLYEGTEGLGHIMVSFNWMKRELANVLVAADVKNNVQWKYNVHYGDRVFYQDAGGFDFHTSSMYQRKYLDLIGNDSMNDNGRVVFDFSEWKMTINTNQLAVHRQLGWGFNYDIKGRGTIIILLKKYFGAIINAWTR